MSFRKIFESLFGTSVKLASSTDANVERNSGPSSERLESRRPVSRSKRPVELNIGLDFGTAFTKVVVGDRTRNYAIPFDYVTEGANPYLLPCILSVDEDGYVWPGVIENSAHQYSNLKMQLLDGKADNECLIKIATFLGLVLEHTRNWLLTNYSSQFEDRLPDWYINVGLPTDTFHNDSLKSFYHKALMLAWNVSLSDEMVTLEVTERIQADPDSTEKLADAHGNGIEYPLHPDKIASFPEFAAQITGYVNSPMRQSDLHALVDIGAGTIDITVFNVTESISEDTQLYPIFTKCVLNLGVAYLFRYRIRTCNYTGQWSMDETDDAPDDYDTAQELNIDIDKLVQIDEPVRKEIRREFLGQLRYTKESRYRRSPRWSSGVPLFLCGGGSRLSFYRTLFDEIESSVRQFPIKQIQLPAAEQLIAPDLKPEDMDRLSVAYGLSFGAFDIGEIRPEGDVEDDKDVRTQESRQCYACTGTGGPRGNDCPTCGGSGWMSI